MKTTKSNILVFILLLCCASLCAQPNFKPDFAKSLKIGDSFVAPQEVLSMRGDGKVIDWGKLEGKVILLDFFDSFCASCIKIMPKLQKLQEQYGDKIKVITVTWQDRQTMEKLFATNAYLKEHQVNLPVIYNDSYLKGLFPHQGVPHEVLVYKGKVQAISSSEFITEETLLKLYNEGNIDLPLKDDYGKADLFHKTDLNIEKLKAGVMISGYQNGVPFQAWEFVQDTVTGQYKSSTYNNSLLASLRALASKAKINTSIYMPRKERVILNVKDTSIYDDFERKGFESWLIKNGFCYERYDPFGRSDSAQARIILEDFKNFFGINVFEAKHKIKTLVLKPCSPAKGTRVMGAKVTRINTSEALVLSLDYSEKFPPAKDKVNYKGIIELNPFDTLEQLNRQLIYYGIEAEIGMEEIDVLVIEESK
ncbi:MULTISPECIES: TlpA family protein disulfide reductase [Sphingobacterium]|uniref:TlpA family protein disulfide reductase n=1 Tax=Sphingobacterium TaxID=28453 RepID=UPI00257CE53C|nr:MULTISPECIES: TlpA disulfide reductase family protein [Sphingobacterium]